MTKSTQDKLSKCHHAPVRVEGRTTKSYYCNQCNEACDLWVATPQDNILDELKNTAQYLYSIDGDCPDELYQAIATLRQLINEEFKPEKSVSSQFIYDILNPRLTTFIASEIKEVIGEDEREPEIPRNDYYWRFRNELRVNQRQRAKQKGYDL